MSIYVFPFKISTVKVWTSNFPSLRYNGADWEKAIPNTKKRIFVRSQLAVEINIPNLIVNMNVNNGPDNHYDNLEILDKQYLFSGIQREYVDSLFKGIEEANEKTGLYNGFMSFSGGAHHQVRSSNFAFKNLSRMFANILIEENDNEIEGIVSKEFELLRKEISGS